MRIVAPSAALARYDGDGPDGNHYFLTDFMGSFRRRQDDGPQAILHTLRGPDPIIPPHFHPIPEFQVFIAGDELWIGKCRGRAVLVHFVDDYTPYGPVRGGASGMSWLLMRPAPDHDVMNLMPGSRAKMIRRAGRNISVQLDPDQPAYGAVLSLIEPHADGLAMYRLSLAPHQVVTSPGARPAGHYGVVLAGALHHGGDAYGRWSCWYTGADEPAPIVEAGPEGADLLVLNFPDPRSSLGRARRR
jgi:hypothetical protein